MEGGDSRVVGANNDTGEGAQSAAANPSAPGDGAAAPADVARGGDVADNS